MTHSITIPRSSQHLTHPHSHIARTVAFILNLLLPVGCTMLMKPNKAEAAVHGCHCPGDMAVRMRKILVRPWDGVRVCHLLLLLSYKTLLSITNCKNGVLKLKLERQKANVTAISRSSRFAVLPEKCVAKSLSNLFRCARDKGDCSKVWVMFLFSKIYKMVR